jgi:acetyl esterase/lipase
MAGDVAAQTNVPGLVVPVPPASEVRVVSDSFVASSGERRQFDLYRPADATGDLPLVVFANGSGAMLRSAAPYVEWARLVTGRDLAAVLYEGPAMGAESTLDAIIREGVADLDSLVSTVTRRSGTLGIDASNVVIWAGSGQTIIGTPFALGNRYPHVRGYVLYYGSGSIDTPRLDVPVFIARAGLDGIGLNQALDSLAQQLTNAGVAVTLLNYPAGQHAFDLYDESEMTARVIEQTLDFMHAVTQPALRDAVAAGIPDVRAANAFVREQWPEAERLYGELSRLRPSSSSAVWRLGLSQLANNHPADALISFDRARELGRGGARDIGLPAARAAVRSGQRSRAIDWLEWALRSFPRIRAEIQADAELAPLLEDHRLRGG